MVDPGMDRKAKSSKQHRGLSGAGPQIPAQRFDELIGQKVGVTTLSPFLKWGGWRMPLCSPASAASARQQQRGSLPGAQLHWRRWFRGPTLSPCGVCSSCVGIAEGRHVDVIEMDAASNTGVDDGREIIEGVGYRLLSARYKIYIDEVHMLSKSASMRS